MYYERPLEDVDIYLMMEDKHQPTRHHAVNAWNGKENATHDGHTVTMHIPNGGRGAYRPARAFRILDSGFGVAYTAGLGDIVQSIRGMRERMQPRVTMRAGVERPRWRAWS